MARYNVEFTSIEGVLNWYDTFDHSNWKIYSQKPENAKAMGSEDPEESLRRLIDAMDMLSNDSAAENMYYLQLLPKDKKADKPIISFCLKKQNTMISGLPVGYVTKQDFDDFKRELLAEDINEEIDEIPEQKNILAGLLENPQIQGVLISAISGLIGSFSIPVNNVKTISGVTDDLDDVIKTLFSKGVKLEHLKKLAEMPKDKIQMLISML
jgi:hypothetical protein